jgi:hypothetical protein
MADPRIAAIIGRIDAAAVGPGIFEELAIGRGLRCIPTRSGDEAFTLLPREILRQLRQSHLGAQLALFFLCADRNNTEILEIVQRLKKERAHAKVIVYADSTLDSGALAIQCVHQPAGGGACDYFVRDKSSPTLIRESLIKHFSHNHVYAYPSLRSGLPPVGQGNQAFIATPYHDLAVTDCYDGIVPALDALGLKSLISKEEVTSTSVLQKVQGHIDASQLVIVNLTEYLGFGPSMNVYFELGYALGRNVPVILVARAGTTKVASNLAGGQLVEYHSRSELAMRLYFGFK